MTNSTPRRGDSIRWILTATVRCRTKRRCEEVPQPQAGEPGHEVELGGPRVAELDRVETNALLGQHNLLARDLLADQIELGGIERVDREVQAWRSAIVTRSPLMENLLTQARLIADSDASVLIQGQSGTGKELLAEIAPATEGLIVSLGLPLFHNNALYNTACLVADGVISIPSLKPLLAGFRASRAARAS